MKYKYKYSKIPSNLTSKFSKDIKRKGNFILLKKMLRRLFWCVKKFDNLCYLKYNSQFYRFKVTIMHLYILMIHVTYEPNTGVTLIPVIYDPRLIPTYNTYTILIGRQGI